MFDGLQEGIIVIQDEKINFMNELSNKVVSKVTGVRNYFKNSLDGGTVEKIDPLDVKLFYVFENNEEKNKIAKRKRTQSESSK